MFDNTFPVLLENNISLEECIAWYKDPSKGPPKGMAEALRFDEAHLEVLRLELPLLLLNFIREQSSKILQASQNCSTTPSKTNHPLAYDYNSPVKTLRKTVQHRATPPEPEKRPNKKRVQLFASPLKEVKTNSGLSQLQDGRTVDIADDMIFQKLNVVDGGETKMAYLEERLSASRPKTLAASSDKLKIGQFPNNNNNSGKYSRRSLDSANANRSFHSSTPHGRGSAGNLNLGDFMTISTKSSKKQKGKNKNRKSDSALLEQKRLLFSPSPNDLSRTELEEEKLPPVSQNVERESASEKEIASEEQVVRTTPPVVDVVVKEETNDIFVKPLEDTPSPTKIVRPNFERRESLVEFIDPDPSKVTLTSSLNQLALLYSFFIDQHLVPNVLVELYLLLELLTVKAPLEGEDVNDEITGIFCTIHNCVFFAAKVLKSQVDLLQFTDSLTLKYLLTNSRLDTFCPEIKPKLNVFLETSNEISKRHGSGGNKFPDFQLPNVGFHSDTDGRENFPSDRTFQDFRKQRDLFYELLRKWCEPDDELTQGDQPDMFGPKVSKMICIQTHPVNMMHFAQLFQSQLLFTVLRELNNQDLKDSKLSDEFYLLSNLRKTDPAKIIKLQERLAPSRFGGPCPAPTFPGSQEFFRDFLRSCGGHSIFIAHLKVTLVSSITKICDNPFVENLFFETGSTLESTSSFSLTSNAASGIFRNDDGLNNSILSLKILAKFLGFIESMAFHYNEDPRSDKLMEPCVKNRQNEVPSIDLMRFLTKSQDEGNLVITIPWIVEFCSVLDSVTVKLPYYEKLFARLLSIYQNDLMPETEFEAEDLIKIRKDSINSITTDEEGESSVVSEFKTPSRSSSSSSNMDRFNAFFLKVQLGWFFEGNRFPRELFIQNIVNRCKKTASHAGLGLDSRNCVKRSLLYTCCPYVSELKVILSQFLTGFKATRQNLEQSGTSFDSFSERQGPRMYDGGARKIQVRRNREGDQPDRKKSLSELQSEMEKNFYQNQSSAVKQCVEFVANRVASNLTRIFKREVVPNELARVTEELRANVTVFLTDLSDKTVAKTIHEELLSQVAEFSEKSYLLVKEEINALIKSKVAQACSTTIGPLLEHDTLPSVAQLAVRVASKKAAVFCKQWERKSVYKGFFMDAYTHEFDKLWKVALQKSRTGNVSEKKIKEKTSGPRIHIHESDKNFRDVFSCDVLIKMKDQTVALLETKGKADVILEHVDVMLCDLEKSLANEVAFYNGDLGDLELTLRGVEALSVDWTVALCAFSPLYLTADVQDILVGLWGGPRPASDLRTHFSFSQPPPQLNSLLSPRNLTILSLSVRPNDSWSKFENLLGRLLKARLILPLALEDQCIRILRTEWHQDLLRRLSSCLNGLAQSMTSQPEERKFFDWVVWFCSNVNYDLDDEDLFPPL